MPISAAVMIQRKSPGGTCHSAARLGVTAAIAWMSYPSSSVTSGTEDEDPPVQRAEFGAVNDLFNVEPHLTSLTRATVAVRNTCRGSNFYRQYL